MTDQAETKEDFEIASSITLKLLGKNASAKLLAADESIKEMYFCRINGFATSVGIKKTIDEKSGEITEDEFLKGDFGLVTADGKEFRSGKAYLPDSVSGPMIASFTDAEGKPVRRHRVDFDFAVFAVRDTNKAGFTWRFKTLQDRSNEVDVVSLQRQKNDAKLKALLQGKATTARPALPKPDHKPETSKKEKAA